ncbi:MAG: hypothetical protein U9O90_04720 [Euryarchaeota archaeon]|nr:hypothetical protein [Euryarchaeota archaeon]
MIIYPAVDAFSVTPDSVTLGDTFTIPYTVLDIGGSGLKQVELWRKGTEDLQESTLRVQINCTRAKHWLVPSS